MVLGVGQGQRAGEALGHPGFGLCSWSYLRSRESEGRSRMAKGLGLNLDVCQHEVAPGLLGEQSFGNGEVQLGMEHDGLGHSAQGFGLWRVGWGGMP